ncbi:hypothetical protein D3C86_1590270 [compost metagenome]
MVLPLPAGGGKDHERDAAPENQQVQQVAGRQRFVFEVDFRAGVEALFVDAPQHEGNTDTQEQGIGRDPHAHAAENRQADHRLRD